MDDSSPSYHALNFFSEPGDAREGVPSLLSHRALADDTVSDQMDYFEPCFTGTGTVDPLGLPTLGESTGWPRDDSVHLGSDHANNVLSRESMHADFRGPQNASNTLGLTGLPLDMTYPGFNGADTVSGNFFDFNGDRISLPTHPPIPEFSPCADEPGFWTQRDLLLKDSHTITPPANEEIAQLNQMPPLSLPSDLSYNDNATSAYEIGAELPGPASNPVPQGHYVTTNAPIPFWEPLRLQSARNTPFSLLPQNYPITTSAWGPLHLKPASTAPSSVSWTSVGPQSVPCSNCLGSGVVMSPGLSSNYSGGTPIPNRQYPPLSSSNWIGSQDPATTQSLRSFSVSHSLDDNVRRSSMPSHSSPSLDQAPAQPLPSNSSASSISSSPDRTSSEKEVTPLPRRVLSLRVHRQRLRCAMKANVEAKMAKMAKMVKMAKMARMAKMVKKARRKGKKTRRKAKKARRKARKERKARHSRRFHY